MKIEITDAVWLDDRLRYTLAELADLSGLAESDVAQLVDYGAFVIDERAGMDVSFCGASVDLARVAGRLRRDFDLDAGGLALMLSLLQRIRELEAQFRAVHARVLPTLPL